MPQLAKNSVGVARDYELADWLALAIRWDNLGTSASIALRCEASTTCVWMLSAEISNAGATRELTGIDKSFRSYE